MGALPGELVIELCADGTVRLDARKLKGSTAQILAELNELARELGATEVIVEKHVGGAHEHTHEDGRVHSH